MAPWFSLLVVLGGLLADDAPAVKAPPVRELAKGLDFPEGPCWLDGKLYFTDYGKHQVWVWKEGKKPEAIWTSKGTGPSGLIPLGGRLLVTCYDNNSLVVLDLKGREVGKPVKKDDKGVAIIGPNDFVKDGRGGIYFSASGPVAAAKPKAAPVGKVYYRTPEGKITVVAEKPLIHYANGLAVVNDGKTLLVSEHLKNRILQYPILEGGGLGKPAVWADLPLPKGAPFGVGADGLKRDLKGYVYAAHYGAGAVLVLSPDGRKVVRTIPIPKKWVSNLAFGDKEKVLYVTALDDPDKPGTGAVYEVPNR